MSITKSTFREINESYTIKEAIDEAKRCLNCKNPSCKKGCPIENDIPGFIHQLSMGNMVPFVKELLKEKDNHFMFSNGNIEELAEAMTKITELPSERLIQMGKVSLEIAESIKLPAIIKQWESYLEYLIKEKTK